MWYTRSNREKNTKNIIDMHMASILRQAQKKLNEILAQFLPQPPNIYTIGTLLEFLIFFSLTSRKNAFGVSYSIELGYVHNIFFCCIYCGRTFAMIVCGCWKIIKWKKVYNQCSLLFTLKCNFSVFEKKERKNEIVFSVPALNHEWNNFSFFCTQFYIHLLTSCTFFFFLYTANMYEMDIQWNLL